MPNRRIPVRTAKAIIEMLSQGRTHSDIARRTGISRRSIGRYEKKAREIGLTWERASRMEDADVDRQLFGDAQKEPQPYGLPAWQAVHDELAAHRQLTLQQLWKEYREGNPTGLSYSRFCVRYRAWAKRTKVTMTMDRHPGEKLHMDFAGDTVPIFDARTGAVRSRAHIFVAAMGVSALAYAAAYPDETTRSWAAGTVAALEFMSAVPAALVPDNPKSVVTKPSRYEPIVTETFLSLARHYDTTVLPARPHKPRDKALVEGSVLLVERAVFGGLRHQKFTSLFDLNLALGDIVRDINGAPFQDRPGSRLSAFEEVDKPAMHGLPALRFELAQWKHAKVQMNYHVRVDGAFYSVPFSFAAHMVDLRITDRVVEIFHRNLRIASHVRAARRGSYSTVAEHMPSTHRAQASWTTERILDWAEQRIGPAARRLCEGIIERRTLPEQAFNSCRGILRLADTYPKEQVERGCVQALELGAFNWRTLDAMLKNGIARPSPPSAKIIDHPNIRGGSYYSNRVLKEHSSC